jgi:hypothetical protein
LSYRERYSLATSARLAFDDAEHTAPGAQDGVDFPVTESPTAFTVRRALADVSLPGQAATAVIVAVPFPSLLAGPAQVEVQRAPAASVPPDVPVDRFVADLEPDSFNR